MGWDTAIGAGAFAASTGRPKTKPKRSQSERFRELWPDIREMILPRRGIFAHRLRADGDQPAVRAGAAALDQVSDRQRDRQASGATCWRRWCCGAGRDADPGRHFVFADATAFESRAAPDRRTAPEGAGARGAAAGRLLRRQQERRAGLAHHERRGRRAQPDRHWAGGFRRRPADGR